MPKLKRQAALLVAFCCVAAFASAQGQKSNQAVPVTERGHAVPATPPPDRAYLQKIWDAWSTLDPANAAPYYSKDPQNVFYDLTPMKYTGWAAYEHGVKAVLAGFQSLKFKLDDDTRVWAQGDGALVTATWHADIVNKSDGSAATLDGRWTAILHHEGGKWLIVHEHVSVPMGAAPSSPGVKRPPKKQ